MGESGPANTVPRPASTKLFQASVPQTIPSYTDDYGPKPPTNRTEVSELSAQNRRNNPHPKEEFFWWRLPAHFPPLIEGCALENTSSTELVNNLKKTVKPLSTYQQDYLKESQLAENLPPISAATNKLTTTATQSPSLSPSRRPAGGAVPHHSEMQEEYQTPRPTRHLRGNTSRYGCSSNYVKAACGVVPTLHPIVNAPNYQTWYANEFGVGAGKSHRRPPTPMYPLHLPPIFQQDRERVTCKSARVCPHRRERGGKTRSPPGPGGFSWLSEWAGPM